MMLPMRFIIIGFLFLTLSLQGQERIKKKDTLSFEVNGNCGMCEKKIESVLFKKGVISADWNVHTHIIKVVYKPKKISEKEIHDYIAKQGYDTEKQKANDEKYNELHYCCKYREN